MVNIKLPITHLIITSKITPQMSSPTSEEDKPASEVTKAEHFTAGSLIRLGSGDTKNIEDLQTEDFIKSASVSPDFSLQHSKLLRLGNFPYRPRYIKRHSKLVYAGNLCLVESNAFIPFNLKMIYSFVLPQKLFLSREKEIFHSKIFSRTNIYFHRQTSVSGVGGCC